MQNGCKKKTFSCKIKNHVLLCVIIYSEGGEQIMPRTNINKKSQSTSKKELDNRGKITSRSKANTTKKQAEIFESGRIKGKIEAVLDLMRATQISLEEAMKTLKISSKYKTQIKEFLEGHKINGTFSIIRQGTATNMLTKIKPVMEQNTVLDRITGVATVTQGSLTVTIPHFMELTSLKTSTYQLLDALTVEFTEAGARSPKIALPLDEYMKKRGLKDRKEARKQAIDDLNILFDAKISFRGKKYKDLVQDFYEIRIIDSMGIKNGIITASFGAAFYDLLLSYPIMPYPSQLWKLSSKRNPNSFYLLRKIAEHKNMNIGKNNENIIAVQTLFDASPNIPSYEQVIESDRALNKRIIEPFERDMDALEDTLTWTYCQSGGDTITREQAKIMDYDIIKDLLVKISWKNYPDQTARLEKKNKRLEQKQKKLEEKTTKKTKQTKTDKES